MESDLGSIIKSNPNFSEEHIQFFLYQILRGLKSEDLMKDFSTVFAVFFAVWVNFTISSEVFTQENI